MASTAGTRLQELNAAGDRFNCEDGAGGSLGQEQPGKWKKWATSFSIIFALGAAAGTIGFLASSREGVDDGTHGPSPGLDNMGKTMGANVFRPPLRTRLDRQRAPDLIWSASRLRGGESSEEEDTDSILDNDEYDASTLDLGVEGEAAKKDEDNSSTFDGLDTGYLGQMQRVMEDPALRERMKQEAEQIKKLMEDPTFREEAKRLAAEQMKVMRNPDNMKKMMEMMKDPKFAEISKEVAEQMEDLWSGPEFEEEMKKLMDDPALQEQAKEIGDAMFKEGDGKSDTKERLLSAKSPSRISRIRGNAMTPSLLALFAGTGCKISWLRKSVMSGPIGSSLVAYSWAKVAWPPRGWAGL